MNESIQAPSKLFFMAEGRALYELIVFHLKKSTLEQLPNGHEEPILVLPGLMTSNFSTKTLRHFLNKKGYTSYGWTQGTNYGRLSYLADIEKQLREIHQKHSEKVTIIGWSMGGIFARAMANTLPNHVRQVITMGSPFSNLDNPTNADWVFKKVSGVKDKSEVDPSILAKIENTPPVPFSAIYSKGDGIVPWQSCMDYSNDIKAENIEVQGSHCGLGHNPAAIVAILDRLSQSTENWKPFEIPTDYQAFFNKKRWNLDFS